MAYTAKRYMWSLPKMEKSIATVVSKILTDKHEKSYYFMQYNMEYGLFKYFSVKKNNYIYSYIPWSLECPLSLFKYFKSNNILIIIIFRQSKDTNSHMQRNTAKLDKYNKWQSYFITNQFSTSVLKMEWNKKAFTKI